MGLFYSNNVDMIQERSNSYSDVKCATIQFTATITILNPTVGSSEILCEVS
jgi:hypothetical protein